MASQSAHEAGGGRRQAHTREQVLHGIRRWHALYGEPPTTADWNPSIARWRAQEWRVARYRAGDPETGAPWPSLNACKRAFGGSFAAAVRAAGLVPHGPGPRAAPGPVRSSGTLTGTIPGNVALDAEVDALRTRIARLEAQLADSRQRARRMSDRARRAQAARDRAEARARALAVASGLRAHGGLSGPGVLAAAFRELARARAHEDPVALRAALTELAHAAIEWRERL